MTRHRTSFIVRFASLVINAGAALLVVLLLFRFGLRLLGVRPDVPLPALVYGLTAPLVKPFYHLFPLPVPYGDRFDVTVIEPASLAAAGAILLVVLALYTVALLIIAKPQTLHR